MRRKVPFTVRYHDLNHMTSEVGPRPRVVPAILGAIGRILLANIISNTHHSPAFHYQGTVPAYIKRYMYRQQALTYNDAGNRKIALVSAHMQNLLPVVFFEGIDVYTLICKGTCILRKWRTTAAETAVRLHDCPSSNRGLDGYRPVSKDQRRLWRRLSE